MNSQEEVETAAVVRDLLVRRAKNHAKWGPQHHPGGAFLKGPTGGTWQVVGAHLENIARTQLEKHHSVSWSAILAEEVGEALVAGTPEQIRSELLDVAAVCIAWAEDIDRS